MQTNPLEIFEIVASVGRFVKLWQRGPQDQTEFIPKELLSHSRVSKTWHAALLPSIWEVYDGNTMHSIPSEIVTKYSHHFHFMIDCCHPGPFHCKTLKRLETFADNQFSMEFIKDMQPTISTLCWKGRLQMLDLSNDGDNLTSATIADTKLSLMPSTITSLELERWRASDIYPFLRFLRRYQFLTTLSINLMCDFHAVLPSTTVERPSRDLLLLSIKTLCLDFTAQRNYGSHDMGMLEVLKYCPNLENLVTIGLWTQYFRSYQTTPFYHYCPLLNSLYMKLALWDSDKLPVFVADSDLASLIESTQVPQHIPKQGKEGPVFSNEAIVGQETDIDHIGGLRRVKAEILTFHEGISEALVNAHAETLEIIELDLKSVYKADKTDMFYAVQNVLYSCRHLRKFSLKHMHREDKNDDLVHILFIDPWGCSRILEELYIHDIGSWSGESRVLEDIEVDIRDGSGEKW
ncbi:hypothetical protein BGX20_005087, partial [Mortierella sp. AD010]